LVAVPKVTGHNGNALLPHRNMATSTVLECDYSDAAYFHLFLWVWLVSQTSSSCATLHPSDWYDEVDLLFTKRGEHRTW